MDTRQLRRLLADPPVEFRPQPVWSLNSVLTRGRLTEMLEQFKQQGMAPVASEPAEFGNLIKAELARWAQVIKDAGITPE